MANKIRNEKTNITQKTKDSVLRTTLKTEGELDCVGMVGSVGSLVTPFVLTMLNIR
jgi:hypothetical protein